ncbi:MAG: hypothetical protein Q8N60_03135, partial [Candidatus Diapherotrites archaeon]|nr:hypothetical protein [Candidatus Diapherotrites archaeon]
MNSGNLHISNGSLTVASTGTLAVPAGYKIIIEKTNSKLVVQSGGKVVIRKTGASPYIYILRGGEYFFVSDFIAGATAKEKEYTSFTNISSTQVVEGKIKLKITEELDEVTYLDRIFLRVDRDNSKIIELGSASYADKSILAESDDRYLKIGQGAEYYLQFDAPLDYSTLEFGAEGYYIVHPEKRKQFFVESIVAEKSRPAGLGGLIEYYKKPAGKEPAAKQAANLLPFAGFIFAYAILLIALRTKAFFSFGKKPLGKSASQSLLPSAKSLGKNASQKKAIGGERNMAEGKTKMQKILQKIAQLKETLTERVIAETAIKTEASESEAKVHSTSRTNKAMLCISERFFTINRTKPFAVAKALGKLPSAMPLLIALALAMVAFSPLVAAIPELFTVQGRLTDASGSALNGSYTFEFILYDSNTASKNILWSETRALSVSNGIFNAVLGDANTVKFLNRLDFNGNMWLGMFVNGEEQTPLIRFSSIGSAFVSKKTMGIDLNAFMGFNDFNSWYHSIFDLNTFYYKMSDVNVQFYGKLDVNAHFVPYIAATKDLNLGIYGIKSFSSDSNFNAVYARQFFGSGANLTGIPTQTDLNAGWYGKLDVNAHFVPFIGSTKDVNLNYKDLNAKSISAVAFFGSGAGLTGIPTQTDVNAGFVGFVRVDNTRDLNLALGGVTA